MTSARGYIIGAIRSYDKHLWEALAATNAEIVYCSGEGAEREFVRWASDNREGKVSEVLYGYFDESFDDLCARLGL